MVYIKRQVLKWCYSWAISVTTVHRRLLCGPASLHWTTCTNTWDPFGLDTSHVILKSGWLDLQAHTFFTGWTLRVFSESPGRPLAKGSRRNNRPKDNYWNWRRGGKNAFGKKHKHYGCQKDEDRDILNSQVSFSFVSFSLCCGNTQRITSVESSNHHRPQL